MQKEFNAANEIGQTRATMGGFLGEIVTNVLGDDSIQKLFETAGKHPDEYAGKPTGEIIGLLKGTSPDLINALLVAQAAERACARAEHAAGLADGDGNRIALQYKLDDTLTFSPQTYGFVAENHKDFSYIGSEKDPAVLKSAQATWLAAQLYLNNEVKAIHDEITQPHFVGKTQSLGSVYADGFRAAASRYYAEAADVLRQHNLGDVADKLTRVSEHIANKILSKNPASPAICAKALLLYKNTAFSLACAHEKGAAALPEQSFIDACEKVIRIIGTSSSTGPTPKLS